MDWFRNMPFTPSSASTFLISKEYDTHDEANSTVLVTSMTDEDCMSFLSGSSSCVHSQDSFEWVSGESHKTSDSDDNETYNNFILLNTDTDKLTNEEVHDPIGSTIRVPFKVSTTIMDSMYLKKYCLHGSDSELYNRVESSVSKHVPHVNSSSKSATCHTTHNSYCDSSPDRSRNIVLDQNIDYRKAWRDKNKSVKEHRFWKGLHSAYSDRSSDRSKNIVSDQNIDYRKAWRDKNKSVKEHRFWKGPNISHSNNRTATSIQRIASIVRCGCIVQSEFESVARPIKVLIVGGVYAGRTGTLVKQTEIFTQVILDRMNIPMYILSDHVKIPSSSHDISRRTYKSTSFQSHGETKIPCSALASSFTSQNKQHEVSDWNNSSLKHVEVVGGKYKGQSGILIKNTAKRSQVLINGTNTVVYLNQDNVSLIRGSRSDSYISVNGSKRCSSTYGGVQRIDSIDSYKTSCKHPVRDLDPYDEKRVHVVGGKYKGQYGWFVKHTAKRTQVVIDGTSTPVNLLPENVSMITKSNQQRTPCESNHHKFISYEPVRGESSQRTAQNNSTNLGYLQDDMSYQTSHSTRSYDRQIGKTVRIAASVKNVVSDDETSMQDNSKFYFKKEPNTVHRTISKSQGNSKIVANQKGLATMDPMSHHHSAANSCSSTIVSYYSATSSSGSESSDNNNAIYDYDEFVKNHNRSLLKQSKRRTKTWSSIGIKEIVKSKDSHPLHSKMGQRGHKLDNHRKDNTLRPSDNQYVFVDYDDETYETCKSFT